MAGAEITNTLAPSYRLIVTGLPARTWPVSVPVGRGVDVAVGDGIGVNVLVGVAVSTGVADGVAVSVTGVAVGDTIGVEDAVGVADSTGVEVGVAVSVGVNVGVGVLPITVKLILVEATWVRILSPLETRTAQSNVV